MWQDRPLTLQELLLAAAASSPTSMVTSAATVIPMTQPRTVRNLIHSARRISAKLSRSGLAGARDGAWVVTVMTGHPPPHCEPGGPAPRNPPQVRRGTRRRRG